MLAPDGMVLGLNLDRGERFERCLQELSIPVRVGDLFCFFTDGVSEAVDADGECFGELRVTAFLEAHAELSSARIKDGLLGEITAFVQGQPQHDDITMIILKIDG
jgi:sigma-B regulation protein RsbU (phosphoserine phosphatase)